MPGVVRYSGLELNYKRQGGFVYLITFINTFLSPTSASLCNTSICWPKPSKVIVLYALFYNPKRTKSAHKIQKTSTKSAQIS